MRRLVGIFRSEAQNLNKKIQNKCIIGDNFHLTEKTPRWDVTTKLNDFLCASKQRNEKGLKVAQNSFQHLYSDGSL